MRMPSGENATELTQEVCPSSGPSTICPLCPSHTCIVESLEPETMRMPSGENATKLTELVCPSSGPRTFCLLCPFHTRIVESQDPVAMHVPSDENATDLISLPVAKTPSNISHCSSYNR